jgi:8-oxo-dGTP diphosphatase
MKVYTIGILFDSNFDQVLLILKNRPEWQKGKYNFPGGHVEEDETMVECVVREFKEECNLNSNKEDWRFIGFLNNDTNYQCSIYTAFNLGEVQTNEDQEVKWFDLENLPENIITNLTWLIPFAKNVWIQGNNPDKITFGEFDYQY